MPTDTRRSCACLLAALSLAGVALAGCDFAWNHRERAAVRATYERMQAAAETAKATAALPPAPAAPVTQGEVRLTLADAIRLALEHSQDVQIAGYDPRLAEADLVRARAVYDPSIFLSNNFARTNRPIQSTIDTGRAQDDSFIEDTWALKGGMKQRLPSGGILSVFQEMNYLDTNSRLTVPNPQYTSRLNFEVTQPILKGLGDPVNRAAIRIATLTTGVTLQDFRQKVMETVARVTTAYWQLAFDLETANVFRRTLEMAREVLRRETIRSRRGVANALSLARASSAVSTREVELLRAENRARNSADDLKRLLNAPDIPLDAAVQVVPADTPRYFLVDVDRSTSMARALSRRPELERARATLEVNRIRIDAADRERLPQLDALLRYTLNSLNTDLGAAMDDLHMPKPASWIAGFEFEVPLGNRNAEAEFRKRRIEYEQTLLEADRITDHVLQEVSIAVRTVLQGRDEVEFTLRAADQARQVVHGEQVRFELGELTNEELLRAQENLAAAQRDHLLAVLNFNLSLTELSRAQGSLLEDQGIEVVWPEDDRPGRPRPFSATLPKDAHGPPKPPAP